MVDELCIEVDKNDNKIGLRPLNDFYTGKYIHRSSHILLFNSKEKVLMQKRAMDKKWYPGLYAYSVSGVVNKESYEECAKREMEEEIGINTPVKLLFIYKYLDKFDKSFHALFYAKSDKKIKLDNREMSSVKWISLTDLKKDLLRNPKKYVPHVRYGLKKFLKGGFR